MGKVRGRNSRSKEATRWRIIAPISKGRSCRNSLKSAMA
jgi:hypothetical protein